MPLIKKYRNRLIPSLMIILSSLSASSHANENYLPLIQSGIDKFNQTAYEQWKFQVKQVENEEGEISGSVQSFDPDREKYKWDLISKDGNPPSSREIKKYRSKIDKRKKQFKPRNFFDNLVLNTIKLEDKNESVTIFSFDVVTEEFGADANQKLKGTLLYNNQSNFIESLIITNTEPFKPQFLVTVDHLKLTLNYQLIQGQVLASDVSMRLKGNMGFIEIDEINEVTFSDYQYSGNKESAETVDAM